MDMIDDILFVHPNDMQQGRIAIQDTDITTNLPYIPGVYLALIITKVKPTAPEKN